MPHYLVLGAGKMGIVLAKDLVESDPTCRVTLVDNSADALSRAADLIRSERLVSLRRNMEDKRERNEVFREKDVVLHALLHKHSLMCLETAIEKGAHFVDLVGENTLGRLEFRDQASRKEVTVLSGMGVSPGITNICVGRAVHELGKADKALIYVGGNPLRPCPPLNYRIVYALDSLLNFYQRPVVILKGGKEKEVEPLSGVEPVSFPPRFPKMECFFTDGLNSLLYTMKGKIRDEMWEKTVRHLGHAEGVKTLQACGFFSNEPIKVGRKKIVPRQVLEALLDSRMRLGEDEDATLLRIIVTGQRSGKKLTHLFEMADFYDRKKGYSSVAKTTSFPASIAARMMAAGKIHQKGVVFPEQVFQGELFPEFVDALRRRGVEVTHKAFEER